MLILGVILIWIFLIFIETSYEMNRMFNTNQAIGAPFYKETFDFDR
jgi:hypothetical protein